MNAIRIRLPLWLIVTTCWALFTGGAPPAFAAGNAGDPLHAQQSSREVALRYSRYLGYAVVDANNKIVCTESIGGASAAPCRAEFRTYAQAHRPQSAVAKTQSASLLIAGGVAVVTCGLSGFLTGSLILENPTGAVVNLSHWVFGGTFTTLAMLSQEVPGAGWAVAVCFGAYGGGAYAGYKIYHYYSRSQSDIQEGRQP